MKLNEKLELLKEEEALKSKCKYVFVIEHDNNKEFYVTDYVESFIEEFVFEQLDTFIGVEDDGLSKDVLKDHEIDHYFDTLNMCYCGKYEKEYNEIKDAIKKLLEVKEFNKIMFDEINKALSKVVNVKISFLNN